MSVNTQFCCRLRDRSLKRRNRQYGQATIGSGQEGKRGTEMSWASWILIAMLMLGSGTVPPDPSGPASLDEANTAQVETTAAPVRIPNPIVVEGITGAVAVASLSSHNVALRSDGTVWEWRTYHQISPSGDPL